jgi:imidazolonepropionase-like amidohydrolase
MLAIEGGTALVGEDLRALEDAVLVVEGERIAAVGSGNDVPVPDGAEIFDARGMTLTPGFIDAHVHIGFYEPGRVLSGGVTTVRDLGWPQAEIHPLADRSRTAGFDGPEIFAAGPILTAPGGYPTRAAWAPPGTGREVRDGAEARAAVEQVAERGASVIKVSLNPPVGPTLDLLTLTAIVERAHEEGLKVTGHVHGSSELDKALDAGMDELAHMLMGDEVISSHTIERMVTSGMTIVPTLSCRYGHELHTAIDNLARFRGAGGNVVYGTDLGNEGPRPGIDPREVGGMTSAGYSIEDIIRSATVDAAQWLGLTDRGALIPGMLADIVAFPDGLDVTEPVAVWRRGRPRTSGKLDA